MLSSVIRDSSMIWKRIKQFHSEYGRFKPKDLNFCMTDELHEKSPELHDSEIEKIVKNRLITGGSYTKLSKLKTKWV